jgi:hypothetical protein
VVKDRPHSRRMQTGPETAQGNAPTAKVAGTTKDGVSWPGKFGV